MNPRLAILLDGGFVVKTLQDRNGHFPSAEEIVAETDQIKRAEALAGYDLFRIYYYDAPPPLSAEIVNPLDNSALNNPTYPQRLHLLQALEMAPNFAIRKGETKFYGWNVRKNAVTKIKANPNYVLKPRDLVPDIKQKGVDLKIGLDIALLSLRQFVQVIVVVTNDSDFVPAFKFARREGMRVFFDNLGQQSRRSELKVHSDFVLPPRLP